MPPTPNGAFQCTYEGCGLRFDTERSMKRHKKFSDKHDYCALCDQDFECYDDLVQHKIFRPDKHNLACRVCGEEFKSRDGLKLHTETRHRVDQRLPCLGCGAIFHRASLMVEHLEFGHCRVVSPEQFMGHIVHKHLVAELLKGGPDFERFLYKISKFNAAQDSEVGGGVNLNIGAGLLDDDGGSTIKYKPIQADVEDEFRHTDSQYPPLSSQGVSEKGVSPKDDSDVGVSDITSTMGQMSVASTVPGHDESTSGRQLKPWAGRSSKKLFPNAPRTRAAPPTEFSIDHHDKQMEKEHGINILNTRFWDPMSRDFNPERFFDGVTEAYFCPFPCEQTFAHAQDLKVHINSSHRITRMKCPSCLKYFKSVTAVMAHCEARGSRCCINRAEDFGIFLDKLTGGFLAVRESIRPDQRNDYPNIIKDPKTGDPIMDPETGEELVYMPPATSYLEYSVTKPVDWKDPEPEGQIGERGVSLVEDDPRSNW